MIVDRHSSRLEHALVHGLLFQPFELGIQLVFVRLFAHRLAGDGVGDFFAELMLFSELIPSFYYQPSSNKHHSTRMANTYIVSSTLSIVMFPWICVMAAPAFFIAFSVSWLIFAASIEYICASSWAVCAVVCSRFFSWTFFLRKAALATAACHCQNCLSPIKKQRLKGQEAHQFYSQQYSSSPQLPAPPFDFASVSLVSAACPTAPATSGWRSWAHPCASGLRHRRTRTTSCLFGFRVEIQKVRDIGLFRRSRL